MTAVAVAGVTKVFNAGRADEVTALSDVDLTVDSGEFVSLIGPSGCGKSTLLRLIADLIDPTAGTVTVAGKPAAQARLDQDYGIAFQQAGLFEWRTVRRNVELPLELRRMPRAAPRGSGPRRCSRWSGCPTSPGTIRPSCPAACSSGSRSPGRSPYTRRCC